MKLLPLLIFLFLLLTVECWGQVENIRFKQLLPYAGIPLNSTNAITKDNRGFMWFGTSNGLVRFDGYTYKVFTCNDNDTTTLSNNLVQSVVQENDTTIWVGTEYGLNKFDVKTEQFTRYFYNPFQNSISGNYISNLLVDKERNIWVGTGNGLCIFDNKTQKFTSVQKPGMPSEGEMVFIQKLEIDEVGNIYILCSDGNLFQYLFREKKIKSIAKFETKLPFQKTEQLYLGTNNLLWIAYGQNVYIYNTLSNRYSLLQPGGNEFVAAIDGISGDKEGNVWLGSTDKGLFIFNSSGSRLLSKIDQGTSTDGSLLNGNGIKRIYCDRTGIIWVATIDGGISYYHKGMFLFNSFRHSDFDGKAITDNRVNCILQASDSTIFAGTEKGLDLFDKQTGTFKNIGFIGNDPVLNLFEDTKHQVWITTYNGNIFYGSTEEIKRGSPKKLFGIPRSVHSITQTRNGTLWLGSMGAGIFLIDNNQVTSFEQQTGNFFSPKYIYKVFNDSDDNIWIGTTSGLYRYSTDNTLKGFQNVGKSPLIHIYSIFQDSKARLWVGSDNGLLLYDKEHDTFKLFDRKNGLEGESVFGISEDYLENLWLLTSNGLLRANVTPANQNRIETKAYFEDDGLPSNLYKQNSICRLFSKEILVGSMNGLGIISPALVNTTGNSQRVILTKLRIFNNEVDVGAEYKGRVILKEALSESTMIRFKHNENVFSFEFSALSYLNPQKCLYKYRLEGFNDNWIMTKADMRIATFTNINPGDYIFEVEASDNGETWGPSTQMKVVIQPPFWLSTPAKIGYLLLLIASFFLLRFVIRRNERKKFIIEQEKAEAQRIHNLDNIKINLFTNISHEFRTPLTLIISPLEKLLSENKSKEFEKPLNTMHRNSQRLLHLVNQLLDFRKLETIGLDYQPSTGDIISFTRNIAMSFNDLAEGKGIRFVINSNIKELVMPFDRDKYDKIIYNLLSNAFKFTHEKGSIALEINFTEEFNLYEQNEPASKRGELVVKVKDTGIGIPQKLQKSIFERFVQANSLEGSFESGSGIGLSLVYEYIKIHGGTIQVESEEGKGSCFTLRIPVSRYQQSNETEDLLKTEFVEVLSNSEIQEEEIENSKVFPSILLVEDNEELRFYLKDNFKKRFRVIEAENGEKGFLMASEMLPDIIISDILMPVMDGIAFCKKLKTDENTSHIPIIILTAMNTDNYRIEGIEAGADDYVVKPFNFKVLEARIKKLLQNQKARQEQVINKIPVSPTVIAITPLDDKFIKKAFELVEKNMANPEFTVEEFSKSMAMSRMLLYKKLISLTGKAPLDFIRTMRLKRAAQLLDESQLNISEVSTYVGFNDAKYFSQCFKKEYNQLPSEYQAHHEKKHFFKIDNDFNK